MASDNLDSFPRLSSPPRPRSRRPALGRAALVGALALTLTACGTSVPAAPQPTVTSVSVSVDAERLVRGRSVQAVAEVTTPDGADTSVTWSSSDESVLVVDEHGVVTAVGDGLAQVVATSTVDPERSGSATVRAGAALSLASVVYAYDASYPDDDQAYAVLAANVDEGLDLVHVVIDQDGWPLNADAVSAALAEGPDLLYLDLREWGWTPALAQVVTDWVTAGGHLVLSTHGFDQYSEEGGFEPYDDGSELMALLQAVKVRGRNWGQITITDPDLARGLDGEPLSLVASGAFLTYAIGFAEPEEGEVWACYNSDVPAIVAANGGRTVVVGPFQESMPEGETVYTNLFEKVLAHAIEAD